MSQKNIPYDFIFDYLIPEENEDFEISARRICELALNKEIRIGRIPKPKKRRT